MMRPLNQYDARAAVSKRSDHIINCRDKGGASCTRSFVYARNFFVHDMSVDMDAWKSGWSLVRRYHGAEIHGLMTLEDEL